MNILSDLGIVYALLGAAVAVLFAVLLGMVIWSIATNSMRSDSDDAWFCYFVLVTICAFWGWVYSKMIAQLRILRAHTERQQSLSTQSAQ